MNVLYSSQKKAADPSAPPSPLHPVSVPVRRFAPVSAALTSLSAGLLRKQKQRSEWGEKPGIKQPERRLRLRSDAPKFPESLLKTNLN